jgi:UDP-N-acetylmuramoyl-tripeptide--D-alanyl-D-alanine ligase
MDISFLILFLIKAAAALAAGVLLVLTAKFFIHMLQLESYQTRGFFFWLAKNFKRSYGFTGIAVLILIALQILCNLFIPQGIAYLIIQIVLTLFFIGAYVRAMLTLRVEKAKKPLVYTARVKRLLVAVSFVSLVFAAGLLALDMFAVRGTVVFGIFLYLLLVAQPDAVMLTHFIMLPVENSVKRWYYNDAKKKLQKRAELIKIGITGSYGKTSTKFILGTILSQKYNTLTTPSSFNTPMGLTRVIREHLNDSHEVFLAEMGARHVGDIEELCRLVQPKYGILTSVGEQHLETFKTFENIKNTKYELIAALPPEGTAFFNADNEACRALYEKTTHVAKKLFGMDYKGLLYARASDIETGSFGSRFTLTFEDGGSVSARTKLLGRHNILNITGCAAIARTLGLSLSEIADGIFKLQPVEHRLCILPTYNGITVIDDAFNSNPQGARMAMEVLKSFEGRKIVITPGMVELGEKEAEENYSFGRLMADSADVVMLVGKKHSQPIYNGLKDAGFDMASVYVYNTLEEASARLAVIGRFGDVVIFENDLPDNYNEQ